MGLGKRARALVTLITVTAIASSILFGATAASADNSDRPAIFSDQALLRLLRTAYGRGSSGYDISWPQCPNSVPAPSFTFAIIGVTGGKAFTENACLAQQVRWAQSGTALPEVYTNVNGMPAGWTNSHCAETDVYCNAYYYGKESAAHAVAYAQANRADLSTWWLDVETENYWTPDQFSNARVIAGAIEYLRGTGHIVGLYSTPFQWRLIAGDYTPGLPSWSAGAEDYAEAQTRCTPKYAFGGGFVKLVQYIDNGFDNNFAC